MSTRVLAVIAAIVAVILFVVSAIVNVTTGNPLHYVSWGLAALAAAVALLALDPVINRAP